MTLQTADVPLKEITAVINELQTKAIYTIRRRAQREAVLGWRDSQVPPGVAARFTDAGKSAYGFSNRRPHYRKGKGRAPDYVNTGSFRDVLADRMPKSSNGAASGEVTTRFSIDGGPLNALSNKSGYIKRDVHPVTKTIHQPDYTRQYRGKTIRVHGSDQRRTYVVVEYVMATRSYRDEFQVTTEDTADITRREEAALTRIVRQMAFTKSGRLKFSAVMKFRGTSVADEDDA